MDYIYGTLEPHQNITDAEQYITQKKSTERIGDIVDFFSQRKNANIIICGHGNKGRN